MTGVTQSDPAHAARRPIAPGRAVATGVAAAAVAATAIGLGTAALHGHSGSATSGLTSAQLMTVPAAVGLAASEVRALTHRPPDFGPLSDPVRRAGCLQGLGRPGSAVLGARPIDIGGRPAVLLVLPEPGSTDLFAVAVRPDCAASGPGIIANTTVTGP